MACANDVLKMGKRAGRPICSRGRGFQKVTYSGHVAKWVNVKWERFLESNNIVLLNLASLIFLFFWGREMKHSIWVDLRENYQEVLLRFIITHGYFSWEPYASALAEADACRTEITSVPLIPSPQFNAYTF